MVQCKGCQLWHLIFFSKTEYSQVTVAIFRNFMISYTYTCGSTLAELDLGENFKDVEVRNYICGDFIEKLY